MSVAIVPKQNSLNEREMAVEIIVDRPQV